MAFSSLGLSAELVRAVADKGYDVPTPIQAQAIPVILAGRDILAGAQTGTGKTAGFTLPLLQRLSQTPGGGARAIRALILTPTRELAAQVEESVRSYGRHLPLRSTVIFGGVGFTPQAEALRRGIDILVATPGRLLDHVEQGTVDLSRVEILVLDEADRMLDMGFIRDIRRILALLPGRRQNLLFSATFPDEIRELADGLLNSPALIEVARRNTPAELVSQVVHPVDRARKRELLSHLIKSQDWRQVLVFTRTKHGANRLAEQLERDGIRAAAIHGNKSQGARTRALSDFKNGAVRVLVATDIAARGLDIDQLPHVVNYELPNVPEDYVHRIGRTGRAGNEGEALSLVCVDEHEFLASIERLLKREIPKVTIDGFAPDPSIKAEPIVMGRGQRNPRGGGRPQAPRPEARRNRGEGGQRPAQRQADHRTGGQRPKQQQPRPERQGGQRPQRQGPNRSQGPNRGRGSRQPAYREVIVSLDDIGNVPGDVDGNRVDYKPKANNERRRRPQDGRGQGRGYRQPEEPVRLRDPAPSAAAKSRPVISHKRRRFERQVPAVFGGGKDEE
ncbi:RNA helicase [Sulfurifustis variabilis]|uniref:ATP-dependent RNA helicase RhlE n=1 Tax=Sulfurifustis variabilis TaxID=1675686 RepID=A0A1B4V4A1_9GAMM|nr:DEAD/DEAH box helicase [Sulfurifustis variabilis]BAU48358.1 RNA helicase [Sulfurifustis variabilis]